MTCGKTCFLLTVITLLLINGCATEQDKAEHMISESANPQFQDLFTHGTNGYYHYRIPGLIVTDAGTIIVYCEARRDAQGDWGDIDIVMRRSSDFGVTWEAQELLVDAGEEFTNNPMAQKQNLARPGSITVNNPVAVFDRITGAVHFLYCVEYGRCFYMMSADEGATFSEPVEITGTFERFRPEYEWKVIATGPGHGIQLRNGRLIVPVWMSTGTGGHAHRPSAVSVIYSDDHGATWKPGDIVCRDGEETPNPSETLALQLQDGRVMLNMRNEFPGNMRLIAYSKDGVSGWTKAEFDGELFEPVCMAGLARLTSKPGYERNRIVFVNPDSRDRKKVEGRVNYPRENITVKMSYDEGETWPVSRVLDPGAAGYCDLAAGPDKSIVCFYERGAIQGEHYAIEALTLVKFTVDWLTDGEDAIVMNDTTVR